MKNAVDDGGVQRDMFSAFWVDAYMHLFEGAKTLIPMVQPGIDIATFSTLMDTWFSPHLYCSAIIDHNASWSDSNDSV